MPTIEEIYQKHVAALKIDLDAEARKTAEQQEIEQIEAALPDLTARYASMLKNPSAHGSEMQSLAAQIEAMRVRADKLQEAEREAARKQREWDFYKATGGILQE